MKGSKQSKTDLLEKMEVDALIKVVQQLLDENAYLKDKISCRYFRNNKTHG